MKIEGTKFPYELKLYSPEDKDFTEHFRFTYPYNDKGNECLITTALGYVCIVSKDNTPNPIDYTYLIDQFEFPLSYLAWLLALIVRFQLDPAKGGYPVGQFSDSLELDEKNWLFAMRGRSYHLGGRFGYRLENRKRHSYIDYQMRQEIYITDEYLFDLGLLDALMRVQKDYEDGKLE